MSSIACAHTPPHPAQHIRAPPPPLAAIPGLMPEEMVAPVAESVGIRLLQKMGWRQGKGIGAHGTCEACRELSLHWLHAG